MKNILEISIKFPILWAAFTVWWLAHAYLYPLDTYKITQKRANYFIVKIPLTEKITIGTRGNLYLPDHEAPVGTFKVIDLEDDECLCLVESIHPGIDGSRLSGISFTTHKPLPPLIIKGVRFIHLVGSVKYYLSKPPVPLKTIEPLSIAGIKNFLYQIEKENRRFRADFIRFSQIRPLGLDKIIDFADKDRIYLGTVEGKLSLIYRENGVLQYTEISSQTLKKFKEDIFFHVILEKKEE